MDALKVAGWFASPAISKLSDLASQRSLRKIGAVIETVETRGIEDNPNLVWWLNDLRDVAYDAEDVLDLLDYKRLKDKELINKGGKVRKLVKQAKTVAKRVIFLDDALNELSKVVDKLDVLANNSEITTLLGVVNSRPANINKEEENDKNGDWRHTAATPSASKVFGREKEIVRLQKLLLESSDAFGSSGGNFSVVSIIGMGGVGKTTLAQTVYNHEDIKSHFDLRAWVCISDRPSDFRKVMIEIMESAAAENEKELEKVVKLREIQNLTAFQQHFEKTLEGKRFLIVLDDVWDGTRSHWDKLYTTFRSAKQGSKILSTTRNQGVVDSMRSNEKMKLEGLEEAEFWDFFKCCAFGDTNADNPELERIGKQIVKQLGCSPLAAKILGAVLKLDLEVKHWSKILEDKSWQNNEDGISASLKLSYDHLPARLKQCFVYCALFPKDYRFEKERLVHIWVALGYVQSSNGKKTLEEDVGQEYFDELEHRCFFQKLYPNYNYYVIHDLFHDLAESLSTEEFFRQEEDNLETLTIPERVRHLFVRSIDLDVVLDKIQNAKRLRSLVHETLASSGRSEATSQKLKITFTKLSGLRILILGNYYSSSKFYDAINDMPHLRYLEFPDQMHLPFMGGLHHLQVLAHVNFYQRYVSMGAFEWGNKSRAEILAKLVNLRYINVASCFLFNIPGIGQLTSLQRLSHYRVREEEEHKISELGNLRQIRDSLRIEGLKKVANKEEAKKAGLDNKQYLDSLGLSWEGNCSDEKLGACEEVLEGLQPHSNLKSLMILRYRGFKLSDWFNKICLSNINHIILLSCPHLKALPPLGEFPFLKDLYLDDFYSLENIGVEVHGEGSTVFPSLEKISLSNMKELREWSAFRKDGRILMPRLRKLSISLCPKLKALPPIGELPLLDDIVLQGLPSLEKVGSDTYGEGNIAFPSLQELTLLDMPQLNEWPAPDQEHGQILWPRLRRLVIGGKFSMPPRCLPASSLSSIQSLRLCGFTVEEQEWFQNLTSLKELEFISCGDLRSLPDTLGSLSSLERLVIKDCHKMVSLGDNRLPPSLKELTIAWCVELTKRCDWRSDEGSSEWNKISHVPLIQIDREDIPHPPPALPTQPSN